ncbi:response regulator [Halobacillus sp. A5]|uniref:response regulator n=1 Tax=Halobacillus sp. A5 TaxID=2880263 RepID=UPI0020A6C64F|nr:response regulator [Halobacillus sp. A5]MCP3028995.1 response regulator [Halobacillus sp. A5]
MIKVMIVEDDFRIGNIHEKFINNIEGTICAGKALSGEEALSILKEMDIDLLLLDIYMPDYLGTDLIDKAREYNPQLDIIIVTAAQEKGFLEECMRKGVFNYLIKPATFERFQEVFNDYKQRQQLLEKRSVIDQGVVDELFTTLSGKRQSSHELPKGIDRITLKKVLDTMKTRKKGCTAEEIGEHIGIARSTARRYLEYLVAEERAEVEQVYGIVGRPERRYRLID